MNQRKHFNFLQISVIFVLSVLRQCGSAVNDYRSQESSIIIVEDAKSNQTT